METIGRALPALSLYMDCVVIGNGESLNVTPLEKWALHFDTFACNRIHLLPFKPHFYVRVEPPAWNASPQDFFDECRLHIDNGEMCIFPSGWREELGEADNIEYIQTCRHFKYPPPHKKAHRHWHLPVICDTNAVTAMMQIAVTKGYSRIILLGCDIVGDHFSPDDKGLVQTDLLRTVHEIAKASCPIPILNATIGGALDVYPRVKFEDLCG